MNGVCWYKTILFFTDQVHVAVPSGRVTQSPPISGQCVAEITGKLVKHVSKVV